MSTSFNPVSALTQTLDNAIAKFEGYFTPGTIAATNNNPGNLKYQPWEVQYGASPGANGFAIFNSSSQGFQAEDTLVNNYVQAGATIASLVDSWAPPTAGNNNNANYVAYLSNQPGIAPNVPLVTASLNPPGSVSSPPASGGVLGSLLPSINIPWSRVGTGLAGIIIFFVGIGILAVDEGANIIGKAIDSPAGKIVTKGAALVA